jgi:phospholipase C
LIWELLNENNISWGYYVDTKLGQFNGYTSMYKGNIVRMGLRAGADAIGKLSNLETLRADLKSGNLPKIVFIDGMNPDENEHPAAHDEPASDIRVGQHWLEAQVRSIVASRVWAKSALFITYDENGGFADHVVPPKACQPDQVKIPATPKNMRPQAVYNASFDQYGFRVPFVMISPFAKRHYVSHTVYDHTSILKFIETRYHLPALTTRDANANDMLDLFDFSTAPNTKFLAGKPLMLSRVPGENGIIKCTVGSLKLIR